MEKEDVMNKVSIRGFSLIELMVVIAVMSVLFTVATSSFVKFRKNINLRNAARAIASDFAHLKQKAVAESVHYKIKLSPGSNSYMIIKGGSMGVSSEYDEMDAVTKSVKDLSNNVVIASDPAPTYPSAQVVFQPRGTTSAGTIVLVNDIGSKAQIVSNLTGRVRVSFAMN
jgi:type IV fimbrial biogenesis protein FimT